MELVASSPVIPATEYTLAHCVVIREDDKEYVVHMKTIERNRVAYHTGNYFQKRDNPREALVAAFDKFVERARRTLEIES